MTEGTGILIHFARVCVIRRSSASAVITDSISWINRTNWSPKLGELVTLPLWSAALHHSRNGSLERVLCSGKSRKTMYRQWKIFLFATRLFVKCKFWFDDNQSSRYV